MLFIVSSTDASESTHICYFSLNHDKEFDEMEKFTAQLNKVSQRPITVSEYQTEKSNPEESFKKLVESGVRCDGLVISGHHTGSFGGKRSNGSLGIDFMEKLSCMPEYKKWFENIQALWLQGCRTLGVKIEVDNQTSADFHTERVGAVLQEDNLTQSFAQLNIEFSGTLDQDNPLSSRYLRLFPQASVFGWTKTAPGEKAKSELSIPYHIAHIAALNNDRKIFFKSPETKLDNESATHYASSILGLLNRKNNKSNSPCYISEDSAVKGWLRHGQVEGALPFSFNNSDLQAYSSFEASGNPVLAEARAIDCELKNLKEPNELLKVIDNALMDESLLGYTFNSIWEFAQRLKSDGNINLLTPVQDKLKNSPVLNNFLMRKLAKAELGLLRKIDYYSFYRDMTGKKVESVEKAIENFYIASADQFFKKTDKMSYDERDFFMTLRESINKNNLKTPVLNEKIELIYVAALKSKVQDISSLGAIYLNRERTKNPKIHIILANLLNDKDEFVRERASDILYFLEPTDSKVLETIKRNDLEFYKLLIK